MAGKCTLYITTSLDGFIADENGNRDWLKSNAQLDELGYADFYKKINAIVMGRKTYDQLKDKGAWPYKDKDVYVITHYLRQKDKNISFIHEDIPGNIKKLKKEGKNIWLMGGSEAVNTLLKEGLIDAYCITTTPVILGSGIRLFKDDNPTVNLKLNSAKASADFVQVDYKK